MASGRRVFATRLASIVFVVIVPLLLAELYVRWRFPLVVYRAPATDAEVQALGWGANIQRCSPPMPKDVKGTEIRVLLLGDSVLECNQGDAPDTLPFLLSRKLGAGFLVKNIAAGGWGTDQELLAFRYYQGTGFRPRHVLLFFTPANDLFNNSASRGIGAAYRKPYFELDSQGELRLVAMSGGNRPRWWEHLLYRSQLLVRVSMLSRHLWLQRKWKHDPLDSDACAHASSFAVPIHPRIAKGWALTRKIVQALNDEAAHGGARLAIVYVPNGTTFDYALARETVCHGYDDQRISGHCLNQRFEFDVYQPFRLMEDFASKANIPFIHNLDAMRQYAARHTAITSDCVHLTRLGADLLSDRVVEYLHSVK